MERILGLTLSEVLSSHLWKTADVHVIQEAPPVNFGYAISTFSEGTMNSILVAFSILELNFQARTCNAPFSNVLEYGERICITQKLTSYLKSCRSYVEQKI